MRRSKRGVHIDCVIADGTEPVSDAEIQERIARLQRAPGVIAVQGDARRMTMIIEVTGWDYPEMRSIVTALKAMDTCDLFDYFQVQTSDD